MFNKFYSFCNNFIGRHKLLVSIIIGTVTILSIINLPRIKYDNNIEYMLPADPDILRDMRFLRQAGFSDKVILSLGLTSADKGTEELIRATDKLAKILPGAQVISVSSGFLAGSLQEELRRFLKLSPQITSAEDLKRLDARINFQGVDEALRLDYKRLLAPGGEFFAPFIAEDPLGIRNNVLVRMQSLYTSVGYGVLIEDNHFISRDGRHSLLVLDTPVSMTEGFGCRKLIDYLNQCIKTLPAYVEASIIAGHTHSVSNEEVIKKDIMRTAAFATIAFLAIFFAAFRDIRAVIFFLIPLVAVLISINLASFVYPALSYFIMGMAGVIVGIADDYAIHVYVAVHTAKTREAVKLITKPLIIAAFITTSVFVAFLFSKVGGYHQLAFFAITSILLCLGFVLFIFPHFLKEAGPIKVVVPQEPKQSTRLDILRIRVWFAVLIILLLFCTRLKFNSDIVQFDGSSKEIFKAEEAFKATWGIKEYPAILVSAAKNQEDAFQATEIIAREFGDENLVAFVSLWPSVKTRKANALNWEKFWKQGRELELGRLIDQAGAQYHFSKDAFKPFFASLYEGLDAEKEPENLLFFQRLKERFLIRGQQDYRLISFFADRQDYLAKMRQASKDQPGVFVVSRKLLSQSISGAIVREVIFLSVIAAVLILALTFILLRNLKTALISLVSVASAIIAVTGTFSIFNLPMNAASLIASMVVVGLSIDYGVFMLYSCQHTMQTGTVKAVWVSAATTIIGAASLLIASHPVLFSIGVTLVSGLLAGFVASQFILPALYRTWVEGRVPV